MCLPAVVARDNAVLGILVKDGLFEQLSKSPSLSVQGRTNWTSELWTPIFYIEGTSVVSENSYLLNQWSRVILEKLTGLQLVKKLSAFYGTQRFITAHTSARHLSLFRASSVQSTHPVPIFQRSILILSSHLRLGLPSVLLSSGFRA
jgi:hypothetical protein